MGLFSKKKIPDGIRVQFYDGNLPGFSTNGPCQLLMKDEGLRITKINPYTEVKLERARILSIEVHLYEREYMAKYHSVNVTTSKEKGIEKQFYVINFLDKAGNMAHLDFWGTTFETSKIMKLQKDIQEKQNSTSYEI
jgi:hypothetical protein